ncbi:MAG: 16S rRNA (cytidine(1402)-2'-O)-methyltransferase [Actinomycetota bacterium]
MAGKLVLCGTPIGNLEDVSARALRVLSEARVIACEDTRRTRKLLSHHGIRARELVAYHEGNERGRARDLVGRLTRGEEMVLVSDAGMPGLSDPGYRLVRACIDAGVAVEVVPGPNAAISALVLSGLPPARFVFEGFLPRKPGDRRRRLEELSSEERTLVLYESPHRVEESLSVLLDILGDRPAALARELTKLHEEVRRAPLSELLGSVRADPPRGEIVVVVQGAIGAYRETVGPVELARRARELMAAGVHRKDAMSEVARSAGVARREVFDALVAARDDVDEEPGD